MRRMAEDVIETSTGLELLDGDGMDELSGTGHGYLDSQISHNIQLVSIPTLIIIRVTVIITII